MEESSSDNIYIYQEEPDNGDELDNQDSGNHAPEDPKDCPIVLMLKLMFNPIEGWKQIRRSGLKPEQAQRECFYPLLAIYAASKFLSLFYTVTAKLENVIVEAVSAFVSFFFGYFCILIVLKAVMPKDSGKVFDTDFGKVFIIMCLSTMCLFFTLTDALPMLWDVLIFLPLWTIYLACRGTRFLHFPESRHTLCVFVLCLLIIGMPVALSWLMMLLLPS